MQKNEMDSSILNHSQKLTQWIKDLKIRTRAVKFLGENIGKIILDNSKIFLDIWHQKQESICRVMSN